MSHRQGLCAPNTVTSAFSSLGVFQHWPHSPAPLTSQPLPCSLRMIAASGTSHQPKSAKLEDAQTSISKSYTMQLDSADIRKTRNGFCSLGCQREATPCHTGTVTPGTGADTSLLACSGSHLLAHSWWKRVLGGAQSWNVSPALTKHRV